MTQRTQNLILGIETSGTTGGAALLGEDYLLAALSFTSTTLYSQRLLPSIEWMLERAEVSISDVRGVAVSKGPGSFTGLRIGMSVAKAIAYANQAPLFGIHTMEALALRAASTLSNYPICTVLDARQGEVYAALWRPQASKASEHHGQMPVLERLQEDFAGKVDSLAPWIHEPTLFVGEGAMRYRSRLEELLRDNFVLAPSIRNLPTAEEIAWLGARRMAQGQPDDLVLLEPYYLRHAYAVPRKA